METLLDWGIHVVLGFQQFSPTFDVFFKSLTFLGNEEFFLLFLPLIYWCIDRRTGVRLLFLLLFSVFIYSAAKVFLNQPRPFQYDSRVKQIVGAHGGGLPSGHTQNTVVLWGYLAYRFRQKIFWMITGFLIIGVPLSRIYLGVHFPTDIIGGYLLGILLLFGFIWLVPRAEAWMAGKGFKWQLGMAFIVPLVLIFISPGADRECLTAGSTLWGVAVGVVLERRWLRYSAAGLWWQKILRFLVGMVLLFGLWMGLRLGFQALEPDYIFRVIRYALVGLGSSVGAPWLFMRIHLADTQAEISNSEFGIRNS
ncbi:MAG: phosphatase PAP2 family protein [Desulfobacterales bacterium]|nr:MAG: phosphatase PAP2 family protein [Desulfobacterales bacterium]